MMWLADVFTGTRAQGWNERYSRPEAEDQRPEDPRRGRIAGAVRGAQAYLIQWYESSRTAAQLGRLNDHMLCDIGITRDQIPEVVGTRVLPPSTTSTREDKSTIRRGSCYLVASAEPIKKPRATRSEPGPCPVDALKEVA